MSARASEQVEVTVRRRLRPVRYRNSCRVLVFVDQPAQDVASSYLRGHGIALRPSLGCGRRPQFTSPVWPRLVVVSDVGVEHALQMSPTPNEEPVQAL